MSSDFNNQIKNMVKLPEKVNFGHCRMAPSLNLAATEFRERKPISYQTKIEHSF